MRILSNEQPLKVKKSSREIFNDTSTTTTPKDPIKHEEEKLAWNTFTLVHELFDSYNSEGIEAMAARCLAINRKLKWPFH